ncbi:MAG: DUF4157 domain-containing protein [Ginsengibacter sp.]
MGSDEISSRSDIDLNRIRIKENSWVAKFATAKLRSNNVAIVLGKTIHLYNVSKEQFLKNEKWVKHEACHVKQFESNGYFIFIAKYLWESLKHGYYNNKYEAEARLCEDD